MTKFFRLFFLLLFISTLAIAQQYRITGKVTSASSGEALVGANVYLQGTNIGAASDENGEFEIRAAEGRYTLICSYIGFEKEKVEIDLTNNMQINFDLEEREFSLSVKVIADRAKERETPVAFTNISEEEMETQLGSRDIPLVLNTTPSVYSTQQGGGAGDARINIRGFDQRNVAIMINGVPVNDMENGWVYWSNWDGLGDATSSIQVQRGLSAVNLATPSIGGTMNIITDPSEQDAGFYFKQEIGSGEFNKKTFFAHTGMIDEKFAMSVGGIRKTGTGVIDATWTDAWAYYFGASYNINKNNRLELYALGAPQRHGQNLYAQNISTYDHDFAKDLDSYDPAALDDYLEQGRIFNQNWSGVSPSYQGHQYWVGSYGQRYSPNFINERENFYHKPQINMNWYTKASDKLSVYTTAYYSGGTGGGTGTYGSIFRRDANGKLGDDSHRFYFGPSPWTYDWDATIAVNRADSGTYEIDQSGITKNDGESVGILRNSRNNQWTIGAISKAYYKVNRHLKTSFGVDWRTAEIEHFREVRDLLGGNYYIKTADDFNPNAKVGLGDKIAYNFTNTVNWLGFYGQGEYTAGQLTAYGMAGWSMINYDHTNHFMDDGSGNEVVIESDNISGFQIKGGASYRLTQYSDVYVNAGYISKVPIFDAVINDRTSTRIEDPKNEQIISFETGFNMKGFRDMLTLSGNFYYTLWNERTVTNNEYDELNDEEGIVVINGMNATHMGLELQAGFQPSSLVRLNTAFSIANWENTNDPTATYKSYESAYDTSFAIYVNGLKVGDAPQTQLATTLSLFPFEGFTAQFVWKYFTDYYAAWNSLTRTDPNDTKQSWETPSYNLFDFHATYELPFDLAGARLQLTGHIFNLLDEVYVQDATDNSQYNSFDNDHDADDAEVFLGLPRTFNLGITLYY